MRRVLTLSAFVALTACEVPPDDGRGQRTSATPTSTEPSSPPTTQPAVDAPSLTGVYLVTFAENGGEDCVTTITENLLYADPVTAPPPTTDWTQTTDVVVSDTAVYALVLEDASGGVVLDLAGTTFVGSGTADSDLSVAWTSSRLEEDSDAHVSGYLYEEWVDTTVTTSIAVAMDADTQVWSGTVGVQALEVTGATESDLWDAAQTGLLTGQISDMTFLLDNPQQNYFDTTDCASDPCSIELEVACSSELPLQMVRVDTDPSAYAGLKDSGQSGG